MISKVFNLLYQDMGGIFGSKMSKVLILKNFKFLDKIFRMWNYQLLSHK